ncbi:MAG: peptide-methionine (S)-S-oxide reductase MsrA [Bdellovibrionota bacterium]
MKYLIALLLSLTPALYAAPVKTSIPGEETAIFAGGCFWCLESEYQEINGVKSVVSGYIGGSNKNPTYKEVGTGKTGHAEAIRVIFDPKKVSFEKLLDLYWREADPTDGGGQFVDRGSQYRTEIFYTTPEQKKIAEASKAALAKSGRFTKPLVTPITKAPEFYEAEDYHQDYYKKNPSNYKQYKENSGRKEYQEDVWKKK